MVPVVIDVIDINRYQYYNFSAVEVLIPSLCHRLELSIALCCDPRLSALPGDTCMAFCPRGDVEERGRRWAKICLPHQSHPTGDNPYPLHQILVPVKVTMHVGLMRRAVYVPAAGSE